jgi:uncharacterized protein YndB with AHSA1/START domain
MTDTADREIVTTTVIVAPRARVFEAIVEPERIVYSHLSGPAFRMTTTFDERDGGTTVTMRMAFETAKERDQAVKVFGAVEGAKQTLARLGQHVTRPS